MLHGDIKAVTSLYLRQGFILVSAFSNKGHLLASYLGYVGMKSSAFLEIL